MAGESSDFGASIAELQAVLLGTDSIDGFLQELAGLAEALGVLMRGSPAVRADNLVHVMPPGDIR